MKNHDCTVAQFIIILVCTRLHKSHLSETSTRARPTKASGRRVLELVSLRRTLRAVVSHGKPIAADYGIVEDRDGSRESTRCCAAFGSPLGA